MAQRVVCNGWLLLAFTVVPLGAAPCSFAAKPGAAALSPFTSAEFSYDRMAAAAALSELVQAELLSSAAAKWVERSDLNVALEELELGAAGYTSAASRLEFGRLTGADFLVQGQLGASDDGGSQIELEIIDPERADVLVRRSVALPVDPESHPLVDADNARRTAKAIEAALEAAVTKQRATDDRIHVAPLYFHSAATTGRLDFFGGDLRNRFAKANDSQEGVRFLHFPRAADAIDEAELIADGLVADKGPRDRLADYYLWGEYEEVESSGVPFHEVEVKLTLWLWNGGDLLHRTSKRAAVARLPRLADEVVQWVIGLADAKQREPTSEELRQKLAKRIFHRAQALQEWIIHPEPPVAETLSPKWLRLWRQSIRLLSVAAFLDPSSEPIRRELVIETTRDDIDDRRFPENRGYWRHVQRSRAWGEYCERFGYEYDHKHIPKLPHRPGLADNRMNAGEDAALKQLVHSAEEWLHAAAPTYRMKGLIINAPDDIPAAVIEQWVDAASEEYLRRLEYAIGERPQYFRESASLDLLKNLRHLANDQQRLELVRILWPLVVQHQRYNRDHFEKKLGDLFARTGNEQAGKKLLAKLANDIPRKTPRVRRSPARTELEDAIEAANASPVAPVIELPMRPISLDRYLRVAGVEAVDYAAGRVWIAIGDQYASGQDALYHCTLQGDDVLRVTFGDHKPAVTDILSREGYLWMTTNGHGVLLGKYATGKMQRFNSRSGLPSTTLFALAANDQTIFCGGGYEQRGVLGSCEQGEEQWASHDLPSRDGEPAPRITKLACNDQWLACFGHHGGSRGTLLLRDLRSSEWTRLDEKLLDAHPEFSMFGPRHRRLLVVDMTMQDSMLWIASTQGLLGYDVKEREFTVAKRLPLDVTAMQQHGDSLWVACMPDTDTRYRGSSARGARLVQFHLPTAKWKAQVNIAYRGRITATAVHDSTLLLGMGGRGSTLVAVELE